MTFCYSTIKNADGPLGKLITRDASGVIKKASLGQLSSGVLTVHEAADVKVFAKHRASLGANEALLLGVPGGSKPGNQFRVLAGERRAPKGCRLPIIHRTREHVEWPTGPGLMLLDADAPKDGAAFSAEALVQLVIEALPALAGAPMLWVPSAGSCVYDDTTGAEVIGVRGAHVFVVVADPAAIPDLGKLLTDRLALVGYGRFELSAAGSLLPRTPLDGSVFARERLVYKGASMGVGLEQRPAAARAWWSDAAPLDAAAALRNHSLTADEKVELDECWADLRQQAAPSATHKRDAWATATATTRLRAAGREVTPEAVEAIAAKLRNLDEAQPLEDDLMLHLKGGRMVSVAEMRADLGRYLGAGMADPYEGPDYAGGDDRIARLVERAGAYVITSFAHGGRTYMVKPRATAEEDFGGLDDEPAPGGALVVQHPRMLAPIKSTAQRVKAELPAVIDALRRPEICGKRLALDRFTHREMLAEPGDELPQWRDIKGTDETWLRDHLQRNHGYGGIPADTMRQALSAVAERNEFDSAQTWLGRLTWDGVPRIEQTLHRYFDAEDTPYSRALGRYIWTGLAGRVLEPGVKADIVPVAVGGQGARKSTTVAAIAPDERFFGELDLSRRDDDTARLLQGRLIVELPELRGLRGKDAESLKAFLSQQTDRWIEKWQTRPTEAPRRGLFFGTTNEDGFLSDPTGSRRWAPFRTGQCAPEALAADRDQLWAEGAAAFRLHGVEFGEVERLARAEHAAYIVHDALEDSIATHLARLRDGYRGFPDDDPRGIAPDFVTTNAVWAGVHGDQSRLPSQTEQNRVAAAMRRLGWVSRRKMVEGVQLRGWEPTTSAA